MNETAYFDRLISDFQFFLQELWLDRGLDRKAPLSWLELDMARYAMDHTGPRQRGVLGFRGIGKTNIVVAAGTCFRLLQDPQRRILISSKTEGAAKATVSLVRQWINSVWFLQHLRPGPAQRDSALAFDVPDCGDNRQPSVSAVGFGGQLEGNRAHTIFPDDVETKANSKTPEARDENERMASEYINILYPSGSGPIPPEIIIAGTPKHEDTLYLRLARGGYRFQAYPFLKPRPGDNTISPAPAVAASSLNPGDCLATHRFSKDDIAARLALPEREFLMEFQLAADLGVRFQYPLRLRDLIVYPCHRDVAPVSIAWGTSGPSGSTRAEVRSMGITGEDALYGPIFVDQKRMPYTHTVAGLDPAGRGHDQTGLAVVGHLAGVAWVKLIKGYAGGASTDTMEAIALALREHGASRIDYEDNIDVMGSYAILLESTMRRYFVRKGEDSRFPEGWACSLTNVRATGQKELRIINTIRPWLENHRLVIDPAAIAPDMSPDSDPECELQYQLSRMSERRKCLREDGKADALEIALRNLTRALGTSPEEHSAQRTEQAEIDMLNERVRDMMRAGLRPPRGFRVRNKRAW